MQFTGNVQTDKQILQMLSDTDLTSMCRSNVYLSQICQDDTFWMNRTLQKLGPHIAPGIPNQGLYIRQHYMSPGMTWREYYIWLQGLRNNLMDTFILLLNNPNRNDIRYIITDQLNKIPEPPRQRIPIEIEKFHINPGYDHYLFSNLRQPGQLTSEREIYGRLEEAFPNSPDLDLLEDNIDYILNYIKI